MAQRQIYEFAWLGDNVMALVESLAAIAEYEDWRDPPVPGKSPRKHGALLSYIEHMFDRLCEEEKVLEHAMDERGRPVAVFNTGLANDKQQFIYGILEPNTHRTPRWRFQRWAFETDPVVQIQLRDDAKRLYLRPAYFFQRSVSELFFRPGSSIQFNRDHFIQDHPERFPPSFHALPRDRQLDVVGLAFTYSERLVQLNWRIAVPFYRPDEKDGNRIQLLLPLYVHAFVADNGATPVPSTPPDCVAILDPKFNPDGRMIGYWIPTKLTLDMARKHARLLGRHTQLWIAGSPGV